MYFVCISSIIYFYTGDTLNMLREIPSLTPPPMKKPRIDAAESKIMKISDLPDLESGVKIWRKALEDAKSNEVGYKSRIEFLEQKIEKLESKVEEVESKVNIILAKNIGTFKQVTFTASIVLFLLLGCRIGKRRPT